MNITNTKQFLVDLLRDDCPFTICARTVHGFAGVKSDYRYWITRRIASLGLVEGRDYVILHMLNKIEHMLTLQSARLLALSSKSEHRDYLRRALDTTD